jgi:sulfide:quinone oxidoreductase
LAYCRSGTRSITLWALSQRDSADRDALVVAAHNAGYDLSQVL